MAGQYKALIEFVNACPQYMRFTSRDLKEFTSEAATPTAVNTFITQAYHMGVFTREPISNPGCRNPRYTYKIDRSFTNIEAKKMTTRPDCIEFKKQVDARYKKAVARKARLKPQARKKKAIKSTASSKQNLSVSDNDKKTVITIYK